jgi:hypothetical protein
LGFYPGQIQETIRQQGYPSASRVFLSCSDLACVFPSWDGLSLSARAARPFPFGRKFHSQGHSDPCLPPDHRINRGFLPESQWHSLSHAAARGSP